MVSIADLNKCTTWLNKRATRKFLQQARDSPDSDEAVQSHAAELLLRVELQAALRHAWQYAKGGDKLAAIEAVLQKRQADQSNNKLKKTCKSIGFNLRAGEIRGHQLAGDIKNPKARINKEAAKAFDLVKFCLVCAH